MEGEYNVKIPFQLILTIDTVGRAKASSHVANTQLGHSLSALRLQ
jgi:hypothetical protein